ncbi:CHU large protein [Seminavis robusta]|uniref:CHU large protein n=1 Tax=Seminavis robusta TaxID=568900 RepID=A0A9N8D9E0_9STRA|nr:CHU large protein [Seminavis robusta]|eukprot:Sro7_g005910.1 CHU large protein (439) ;mRNA; f:85306-86743
MIKSSVNIPLLVHLGFLWLAAAVVLPVVEANQQLGHGSLRRLDVEANGTIMEGTAVPTLAEETIFDETAIDESDVACGYTVCPMGSLCCGNTFCVTDSSLCSITSATPNPTISVPMTGAPTEAPSSSPVTPVVPPNNDLCTTAEGPLTVTPQSLDGSLENRILGTTTGATAQSELRRCGGTISSPSVWYTVVGNGAKLAASTCWPGTDLDTQISVFRAGNTSLSCDDSDTDNLVCIGGNDDAAGATCDIKPFASRMIWKSEVGVTYYILVHGFVSRVGDFELNVEGTNDQCQYALQLQVGDTVRGDTIPAALPFEGVFNNCGGTGLIGGGPALWYHVVGTGSTLQATACPDPNSIRPVRISMFEASCDNSDSCVGGADPDSGCATYEWDSQAGTNYYILVHSQAPYAAGYFDLTISNNNNNIGPDVGVGRGQPDMEWP